VKPTLLIVDDHAGFRSVARALLEADGYDVVGEAEDGESALVAVRRLSPDVVLLDVVLPDLDGFTVCDRMTAGDNAPAIVMTSSHDVSLYRRHLERSAAMGFIGKSDLSGQALAELTG
jgi:DNA-binding NarL/FixJ family response regulator